jgi:tRNA(His) guanylyltransferase
MSHATSKLVTTVVSTFTAYYVHLWSTFFPDLPLTTPLPSFDGRAVQYPTIQNLRDYMSWRQVDCKYPFAYYMLSIHHVQEYS